MFTPSQLEQIPVELEKIFRELERDVMTDIVRRISINSEITRTADWQLIRLVELGKSSEYIKKRLAKVLKLSECEIDKLYSEIIPQGYAYDENLYNTVGVKQIPFKENAQLQQLIEAVKVQTNEELTNITQSLGFAEKIEGKIQFKEIAKFYQNTLDKSMMEIATGVMDYNTVIKKAIETMTKSGLRTVYYASGWSNRVDVAARRALMTGVAQVTGKISDENAEKLHTDKFEVSWHGTARPTHQVWQGKVFTKQELIDNCGLGTVTGLKGANCRHDYWPFVEGISKRTYTDEQLDKMNAEENTPKEFKGKQYTAYEATQKQRKLETFMRKQRRDIQLCKTAKVSEDIISAMQGKYRKTMSEYTEFSKAMDLPQQMQRVYADGLKDIGGHGRLKSPPKTFTNPAGKTIIEVKRTQLNSKPNSITQKVNKNGGIDRNYYNDQGIQNKQISNNSHNHKSASKIGLKGEHAHDYTYDENNKVRRSAPRELTVDEREENQDIL